MSDTEYNNYISGKEENICNDVNPEDNVGVDITMNGMIRYACMGTVLTSCSTDYEGVLVIPEGVQILASNCFRYCKKLTGIVIPSTLEIISRDTFRNTTALSYFEVNKDNKYYSTSNDNDVLFDIEKQILVRASCNIEEYVVPETVLTIRHFAFHRSKALKKIHFPANLKEVFSSAFEGCTSLAEVSLPDTVTKIGRFAFGGCTLLKSMVIPCQVKKCSVGVFYECSSLENIHLPENLTSIDADSFAYCVSLREIYIPSAVKKIDSSAFQGCESLVNIVVADNNAKYSSDDNCLYDKYQTSLLRCSAEYETFIAPELLSDIQSYAFSGCMKLQKVFLPKYLLKIEDYTFGNCQKLDSIDIPENVIAIKKCAFENCKNLVSVNIAENSSLRKIGAYAFAGCEKLENINLPDILTDICDSGDNGGGTFSECTSLKEIDLPPKINYLNESIFYNCKSLTKVKLPYGLDYLDQDVFFGCDNIKTVILRNVNTTIEEGTFPENVDIIVEESQLYNKIMFE